VRRLAILIILISLSVACRQLSAEMKDPPLTSTPLALSQTEEESKSSVPGDRQPTLGIDKWSLWLSGPHLRGANIWQRVVVPDLDGDEFLGSTYVGPPYAQVDFDRLSALGANYVNISHPGLFTETPPYVLDKQVQTNLDRLLEMIEQADMFAVITFRTGPGRSDFTFYREGAGDWFDQSLLIESVWSSPTAQDAWVEMWRYTVERYRNNPIVVGYDLMCEPNAAGVALNIDEPDEFYPQYANTLYDWNQFYPRLVGAIRTVDPDTPILVSGTGWGAVRWLPLGAPHVMDHERGKIRERSIMTDQGHQTLMSFTRNSVVEALMRALGL